MSLTPEKVREFCTQFSSLHDGLLNAGEVANLEQSLQEDSEAMRLYVRFTRICAGLDWDLAHSFEAAVHHATSTTAASDAAKSRNRLLRFVGTSTGWARQVAWRPALMSIAAILLVGVGVAISVFVLPLPRAERTAQVARSVARLARTSNCQWKAGTQAVQPGDELRVGQTLDLAEGRAEIEFFGGALVTLEGPAVLTVRSEQEWALERGRLAARLPKGHAGFNLTTPAVNVAKCSTEFTVEVDEHKRVDVHVVEGQMEASSNRARETKPIQLTAGMSAQFDPSRTLPAIRGGDGTHDSISPDFARWQAYSNKLRGRRDLIGYYVFEQVGNDSALPNVAQHGVGGTGSINGAFWTTGRFTGKQALDFGDRRHVMLGLKYKHLAGPLTIVAWVCPREVGLSQRVFSSPPTLEPRGFGFGLTPSGLRLTAWSGKECESPTPLVPGKWIQVAIAIGDKSDVMFYHDGRVIGSDTIVPPLAPAEDEFFIGSYGHREFFQGRIDELAIFSQALSASEIRQLYQDSVSQSLTN